MIIVSIVITIIALLCIILDVFKKINLGNKSILSIFLILCPHIAIIIYTLVNAVTSKNMISKISAYIIIFDAVMFFLYLWTRLNVCPYLNSKKEFNKKRIKILLGGRRILLCGIYMAAVQSIMCTYLYIYQNLFAMSRLIKIADFLITICMTAILIANGIIRILVTSKRLNILKRIIVAWTIWIPLINIFTVIYACKIAKDEYEHEMYKANLDKVRAESDICKTKYPLVMIHGVGFRDFKYLNYWGRIPRELIKNGATVYYGNQEAFGTVEYNANDIKEKILNVIKETGKEKVNIIAHSKGGLDARYTISKLNMGKYVASVTMISSPHRGVKFVDYACKLPDKFYKFVAKIFNKYFALIGDKNPDFYTATRQFSTYDSKKFNDEVKDVEGVYYQSYASVMNNMFSDFILTIPYLLVKITEGSDNDGLVSVESAKWGDFKGVIRNTSNKRGISHGDVIDLRRDDYNGFDVVEKYVQIVSELKNMGY